MQLLMWSFLVKQKIIWFCVLLLRRLCATPFTTHSAFFFIVTTCYSLSADVAKDSQICLENIRRYFEQKNDKNIMQHVVALDITITDVHGQGVKINTEKYFTPMGWR
jgi:hypothetical protein